MMNILFVKIINDFYCVKSVQRWSFFSSVFLHFPRSLLTVNYFYIKNSLIDVSLGSNCNSENTAQKMKFSIKDFFIKCETSRPEVFYKKGVLKSFTSNL